MTLDMSLFKQWRQNPQATEDLLNNLDSACGVSFPADYKDFLRSTNGGEGWLGDEYLVFWKTEELKLLNYDYEVATYAHGLFLFGSNGGGDAFAFDVSQNNLPIVRVPFVGMNMALVTIIHTSFSDMLTSRMSQNGPQDPYVDYRGMELFEIQPIILGGSPTDPANKAWLNREQHIQAVRYWNKIIKQLRDNDKH